MSSAGTLRSISSGTRTILPVDVQDEDGLFTRGFVQDILDDGKVLVRFSCGDDSLKTVVPERLFTPRSLPESKGYGRDLNIFQADTKVEVLVRVSPGSTARWYPGNVTYIDDESLVDVEMGGGVVRKGLFWNVLHSTNIQLPLSRACARFTKVTLTTTKEVEVSEVDEDLRVAWEKQTRSLIVAVDPQKKLVVVVVQVEVDYGYFPSSQKFEEILFELRGFGSGYHSGSLIMRHDDKAERVLDRNSLETPEETSEALMTPEMLVQVFRFLDLKNRQILRGVCGTWRDVMDTAQVCGLARFSDNPEEGQPHSVSRAKNSCPKSIERFRYFSQLHHQHLTTIAVHCTCAWDEFSAGRSFVDILVSVGSVLVPRLKTLILYDGHVSLTKLVWGVLQPDIASRILLRNVILHNIVLAGVVLLTTDMHVRVKSGALDLTSTDEDDTTVPDDITGLLNTDYIIDDKVKNVLISVRKLLVPVLAGTALGCLEDYILTEIAGISEEWARKDVMRALKVLDPSCFRPEMEDEGVDIRLSKSSLRNSTLHVCKAILADYYEATYRCGDITCCKKRKRS